MVELINDFSEVKNSNLVVFVEKKSDINLIKPLKIGKNIIDKINSIFEKNENSLIDFYI